MSWREILGGTDIGSIAHNTHNTQNPADLGSSAYFANIAYRNPKRREPSRLIICEGWATGCTLAEDKSDALVLAAIDAGNLKPVAIAARCRWPLEELVIAYFVKSKTIVYPHCLVRRDN